MHENEQLPSTSRVAAKARNRAGLRRKRFIGAVVSVAVAAGVVIATIGSASADPSAGDWAKLRNCESGGNYATNTGNGYYGAYQFDLGTWASIGGSGVPSDASPATQDALAYRLWQQRGWSPWTCAAIVGLPEGGSGGPTIKVSAAHKALVRPVGHLDGVNVSSSRTDLRVSGWALDRTSPSASIAVKITVNGRASTVRAAGARADVNRTVKVAGRHGFSVPIAVQAGTYRVCATALGRTHGNDTNLGCKTVVVKPKPRGAVSVRLAGNNVVVAGWADDPSAPRRATTVSVFLNGRGYLVPAPHTRHATAHSPANHGFTVALGLRPGVNTICTIANGIGGSQTALGCHYVRLPAPVGAVDKIAVKAGKVSVAGWADAPNIPGATLRVQIIVNGHSYTVATTSASPDVNRSLHIGGVHRFSVVLPAQAGANKVTVVALGTVAHNNTTLASRTVRS